MSTKKQNCWEFMKCGRESGGAKEQEMSICPAALASNLHGANSGEMGGRACWVVAGTFGTKECNLTFSEKITDCVLCDFYQDVLNEENDFEIFPTVKTE